MSVVLVEIINVKLIEPSNSVVSQSVESEEEDRLLINSISLLLTLCPRMGNKLLQF